MSDSATCSWGTFLPFRCSQVRFSEKPDVLYVTVESETDLTLLRQTCRRRARSQEELSRRHMHKMQKNHENIMANVREASQHLQECFRGLDKLIKVRT